MKLYMKSRRINTPYNFKLKEVHKKSYKNEIDDTNNIESNKNQLYIHTKKKSILRCTHYPNNEYYNNEVTVERKKSPLKKKVMISMHKTTNNWGIKNEHSYGKRNNKTKGELNLYERYNLQTKVEELPELSIKENTKFNLNPTSYEKDQYIRYIMDNKKSLIERKISNKKYSKKISQKEDLSMDSGRRDSILSNNSDLRSFKLGGISFEVHSKVDNSSVSSLEYLEPNISKEMNLMFYDFNGSQTRMNSNSPYSENPSSNRKKVPMPNKTVQNFFKENIKHERKEHIVTKQNKKEEIEDQRSKSPLMFGALNNISKIYIKN